jgi:uncharacterized protein YidB (DUF937 family)
MTTEDTPHDRPNAMASGTRRGVTIGVAGGLLAGTAAGLVFGVPGLTSAAPSQVAVGPAAVVQQVDEDGSTMPSDAPAEMEARLREMLQSLVDDGTITAAQADAVTTHLVENRPERGERGERGEGRGPGGRHGGLAMFGRGVASEALTDLLGLDAQDLRQQLRDGATLSEIASTQGVDPQAVVDELVGELEERVDNAVENGRIDQTEADEKLAEAEARITDMVENGRPGRGDAAD